MKTKKVWHIILPNIQAMICGVYCIIKAHNLITLVYTDNTRESGLILNKRWAEIHEKPFDIVSEVQSQRKGGAA